MNSKQLTEISNKLIKYLIRNELDKKYLNFLFFNIYKKVECSDFVSSFPEFL